MGNKNPPWQRSKGFRARKVDTRNLRQRILIVCEGAKTEPNYFRGFRVNRQIYEIDIQGIGYNTASLVKKAVSLKEKDDYDQVWCVFDRDSFPAQDFNAAFEIASHHDINIAYSNQAFELWYLLRFHYYDSAIQRKEYCEMLSERLGHKYEKNSETIYDELLSQQTTAIRNAEKLYSNYKPCQPERDNPSTTVHLLVKALNELKAR